MKLEVEKTKKSQEDLVSIDPGDRAILPDYGLKQVDTNESFEVTYEVEIVEVSMGKVKVKAIDFTSNDKFARDPKTMAKGCFEPPTLGAVSGDDNRYATTPPASGTNSFASLVRTSLEVVHLSRMAALLTEEAPA